VDVKLNRKNTVPEQEITQPEERRSHLVHRAGSANSGLFPGWGPKF
jgi:hypothetical protein